MTPEDKAEVQKMLAEAVQPFASLKGSVDKMLAEFPGMSKAHAVEAAKSVKEELSALIPKAPPPATPPKDPDALAVMSELDKFKAQVAEKEKLAAITVALSKAGLRSDVNIDEEASLIASKVKLGQDGRTYVFESFRTLDLEKNEDGTPKTVPEAVPLEIGIKRRYEAKKYMLQASNVSSGSGSTGSNGVKRFAETPTAQQLEKNPDMAEQYIKDHGEDAYNAIMAKDIAEAGKGRI